MVRKKNSLRVVLTMDLIMQSIVVEVDGEELEPVDSGVCHCSGASRSKPNGSAAGENMPETKGLTGPDAGERILATATSLFALHGYNGVSTRDIASAAQVNEVTIFRHYPRKHDLYLAVMKSGLRQLHLRGDLLTGIS